MSIENFPLALQVIIQQNMLEQEFSEGLRAKLGFREIADKETVPTNKGETVTKTRPGLKAPNTNKILPSANVGLDNGMTPSSWQVEQYTLGIDLYGDTIDLNIVQEKVAMANQFVRNSMVNGQQASASLDILARDALFNAYLSGNTRVSTTLGAAGTTVAVDDVRGFEKVFSNGNLVSISSGLPLAVKIGSNVYSLIGSTRDGSNVSTSPGGFSGTLTFSANVLVADGTAGIAVVSAVAPTIVRGGNKGATSGLISTDFLTLQMILSAVAVLDSDAVPTISGLYNCYLSYKQMVELFQDADFKSIYRGAYGSDAYKSGMIIELVGVRFITTNNVITQTLAASGVNVKRAIVCGSGSLIEGTFAGQSAVLEHAVLGSAHIVDGVVQIARAPLDRLGQSISQSWSWIGGYCVPTDITATTAIIPTGSNAYYKRCVILETA